MNTDIRTVLFVDDEVDVLNSIRRQFRKSEFEILYANSSSEALELLSKNDIQVIITDERMPGMSGVQLLKEVKIEYPDIVRIILSGYADTETIVSSINQGEIYRFVTKPWDKSKLFSIIMEGFAQYNTIQCNKVYMQRILDENNSLLKQLKPRNASLEITLEILNLIPKPVIAVTKEGHAELLNNQTINFFQNRFKPGIHLRELFSSTICDSIMKGLQPPGGQKSIDVQEDKLRVRILTRALRPSDPYMGLLFLETFYMLEEF